MGLADRIDERLRLRPLWDGLTAFLDRRVAWSRSLAAAWVAGLGLCLLQMATGLLLLLHYQPGPEGARESLRWIDHEIAFGWLVRGCHVHGPGLLFLVGLFIFCATIWRAAYRAPREGAWWLGLAGFGLLFGLAFTGTVLPWDQHGFWAARVALGSVEAIPLIGEGMATWLRGGETVGSATLARFSAFHIVWGPLLLVAGGALLARAMGASSPEASSGGSTTQTIRAHLLDGTLLFLVFFGLLVSLSVLVPPRVTGPVDPVASPPLSVLKPHWYLLPPFQAMRYSPGGIGELIGLGVLLLLVAGVPLLDRRQGDAPAPWWLRALAVAFCGTVIALGILGLLAGGGEGP